MGRPEFQSWTPETFEQTGSTPQDAIHEVEMDALVEKYSKDWLIRLFCPIGIPEVLEGDIRLLMQYRHQSYDAVMSMPCSRRRRFVEKVVESQKSR